MSLPGAHAPRYMFAQIIELLSVYVCKRLFWTGQHNVNMILSMPVKFVYLSVNSI